MAKTELPSNSNRTKEQKNTKTVRQVASAIDHSVKVNRSPLQRMFGTFFKCDLKSLKKYVIEDLLIPNAQEMFLRTMEMWMFEDVRANRSSSGGKKSAGWTERKQYDKPTSLTRERRESGTSKFIPEVDDIYLETRGDAEQVIEYLRDLLDTYEQVTVADLYQAVGKSADWTLNEIGWEDLSGVYVTRTRRGYRLDMPRCVPLN